MKNKENKTRPFMLTRSLSHALGGSRHNVEPHGAAPQQHFHGLPLGSPACSCHNCVRSHYTTYADFAKQQYYTPSLRSTSATASDVQAPSIKSHGYSSTSTSGSGSTGTSSHYSGFNSSVYGTQKTPSPVESPPHIHNLLDLSSAALVWDVRAQPKQLQVSGPASMQIISPHVLSFPVIANAPGHIRLISPDFPWSIEIGPKQLGIPCSEVLHALYDMLSSELEDAVWSLADERKRSSIVRAWKRRPGSGPRILKADWLGKHYMFKGIYRDAGHKQQLLRPDAADVPETLIVAFGKA